MSRGARRRHLRAEIEAVAAGWAARQVTQGEWLLRTSQLLVRLHRLDQPPAGSPS